MAKRFNVYRQAEPINMGETFGRSEWRANLVKVGEADSMEEAKRLTAAPVLEAREAREVRGSVQ